MKCFSNNELLHFQIESAMLKQDAEPKEFVFSNSRTGVNIDSIKTGWRMLAKMRDS